MSRVRKTFQQTLVDHVDTSPGPDNCWPWSGCRKKEKGKETYGIAFQPLTRGSAAVRTRRTWAAHRAYLVFVEGREVPGDAHVCHTCDNPPCCNPRHLVVADAAWNVADMMQKGRRGAPLRGEDSPTAILTEARVRVLKRALKAGVMTRGEAQDRLGLSEATIRNLCDGKHWAHVKPHGSFSTLHGNRRPSALSKRLRASIRQRGMRATAKRLGWSVEKLRVVAYPLAPGQSFTHLR